MVRVGKISDDIAKQAKAEPIELRIRDNPYGYYLASAYHESERAANGELRGQRDPHESPSVGTASAERSAPQNGIPCENDSA